MPRFEHLLTLEEAADALGVAPGTLARWIAAGRVRAFRTPGGHYRIALSDLALALRPARSPDAADETTGGEA